MKLFGEALLGTVIVCDRYSAYKRLARLLGGKVTLAWCWSHMRRDFIDCAAGQVDLTALVPGMDRADRRDLPPERGAAGALRPRAQAPGAGVRRGADRAEGGARRPVRGGRTGVGRPAGRGARGQGAALAAQPPRRAERLRRSAPGPNGQQQGREIFARSVNRATACRSAPTARTAPGSRRSCTRWSARSR